MTPNKNRIIFKEVQIQKSSLIIYNETSSNIIGEVMVVGESDNTLFEVGDKILSHRNSSIEFSNDGEKYFVIDIDKILLKL